MPFLWMAKVIFKVYAISITNYDIRWKCVFIQLFGRIQPPLSLFMFVHVIGSAAERLQKTNKSGAGNLSLAPWKMRQ